jgi:hypothetical protein
MTTILNGICRGGPNNGKGLTHDKRVKFLVASNNDGHEGEYRYDGDGAWLWNPKDTTMAITEDTLFSVEIAKSQYNLKAKMTRENVELFCTLFYGTYISIYVYYHGKIMARATIESNQELIWENNNATNKDTTPDRR